MAPALGGQSGIAPADPCTHPLRRERRTPMAGADRPPHGRSRAHLWLLTIAGSGDGARADLDGTVCDLNRVAGDDGPGRRCGIATAGRGHVAIARRSWPGTEQGGWRYAAKLLDFAK